jgi:hypothetical protein
MKISLNQQIEAMDIAISTARTACLARKMSERDTRYQTERLQAVRATLVWLQDNRAAVIDGAPQ